MKNNDTRKHPLKIKIKYKITLLIFVLITAAIAATWLLNKYFLKKYYIHSEKYFLKETYYDIQRKNKDDNSGLYNTIPQLSAWRLLPYER